jgi:hypothetical protein
MVQNGGSEEWRDKHSETATAATAATVAAEESRDKQETATGTTEHNSNSCINNNSSISNSSKVTGSETATAKNLSAAGDAVCLVRSFFTATHQLVSTHTQTITTTQPCRARQHLHLKRLEKESPGDGVQKLFLTSWYFREYQHTYK